MTLRGKLIVITGIDGSGKTTQIEYINRLLLKQGASTYLTKQPTTWYRNIPEVRKYLDTGELECRLETLALLSASDRMMHLDKEVIPRINSGTVVISDRYVYSAYAYFKARGLDETFVKAINDNVLEPDIGVLLKVDAVESCERIKIRDQGKMKFEEKDPLYLEKVQLYLEECIPKNFAIIDANQDIEMVSKQISEHLFINGFI